MRRPRLTKKRIRGLRLLASVPPLIVSIGGRGRGDDMQRLRRERDLVKTALDYIDEMVKWSDAR